MTSSTSGIMDHVVPLLGTMALLGSALVGGVFFAFSSFVMKALANLPPAEGMAAMNSINVVVLNRSFLGAFVGTTVLSVIMAVVAQTSWAHPSAALLLSAAIFYVFGVFLVTVLRNVPLNDQLAAVSAATTGADDVWRHYLDRWTMWNHVRTAAAMLAAMLYSFGLLQS